jgi:acyl-coenzyme A thioesterase PaaI-like protein
VTAPPRTAELRRFLSRVTFVRRYGFTIQSTAPGRCTLAIPFRRSFERPGGVVSGPVFLAAADVAMWVAIMTRLGLDDRSVTVTLHMAFLGGVRGEPFRCTARVLRLGRRFIYGVVDFTGRGGRPLAHATVSYLRPELSP